MALRLGKYRHYKGGLYQVFGMAQHSETRETLVVYQALGSGFSLWVRPAAMFAESVTLATGVKVPRFEYKGPTFQRVTCEE